ncbi:unnamed protein product [Microthlaspi erraticum]|uniref:DUF4283 domain-containing protein n=1 Tax=Microthlaspi erraticum TaxID=1685480 RepID=A0A6D2HVG8_9BRAS|nr:unnamed protein product [Microthlaspi erraticum]
MNQLVGAAHRNGSPHQTRRRLAVEDEIIRIPDCDINAVSEQFKLTLIGRTLHKEGRSIDALIKLLPKPKIWDVEGRAHGINLGNGRFQFDFDHEEDLNKVLDKRPWHFNRWSFALEKWEPFTREDFPTRCYSGSWSRESRCTYGMMIPSMRSEKSSEQLQRSMQKGQSFKSRSMLIDPCNSHGKLGFPTEIPPW